MRGSCQPHYRIFLVVSRTGWSRLLVPARSANAEVMPTASESADWVSNAFFELEFQQTGAYVYRLYRAAFGNDQPLPNPDAGNIVESKKIPAYAVFVQDRARVVAGANQAQAQLDLANAFVQRAEFLARYPTSLSGAEYVELTGPIQTDSSANLNSRVTPNWLSRSSQSSGMSAVLYACRRQSEILYQPLRLLKRSTPLIFYTQYADISTRLDIGGFLFWPSWSAISFRCSSQNLGLRFHHFTRYQERFSPIVTHFKSECGLAGLTTRVITPRKESVGGKEVLTSHSHPPWRGPGGSPLKC